MWKNLIQKGDGRKSFIFWLAVSAFILLALYIIYTEKINIPFADTLIKHHVCQTFNGRLGNHMHQYASIYGIARLNNLTIILGEKDDLVQFFNLPSVKILRNRKVCKTFIRKMANHCCVFDDSLMTLNRDNSYVLGEYLQSWKYFSHVFDDVLKELTFADHIRQPAEDIVENYRAAYNVKQSVPPTVVGVHLRRGDLVSNHLLHLDGVIPVPDQYIYKALDFFRQRIKNVLFIVCSDDMIYAKELLIQNYTSIEFVHTFPVQDMAVLASCDHVIMTSGSFGWWAGFLSRGTVVYYKYPVKEASHARTEYNYEDLFPPSWIGLE